MHASSFENMARCHARYLAEDRRLDQRVVVDIGGADVNGGYRPLFDGPRFRYLTVDLQAGPGVDVVLEDPYRLPFDDASVDIVLSGQMLEHCEFFWLAFAEMIRVLKPDGYLFLIAPSAGPIHRYPVDCYRFYPDAYSALARHAGCHLVESWLDDRGPWRDLVGVFSPTPRELPAGSVRTMQPPVPVDVPVGSDAEEAVAGGAPYLDLLREIHARLEPPLYLEVGVRRGASLVLARGPAIGVDPDPDVAVALPASTELVRMASDEYFRQLRDAGSTQRPDLAFIDGMHLFEYVLRDFMNIERMAGPAGLVVVDDIFPSHPAQAERARRTRVWTGDVWKLRECLAQARPDLVLVSIDTRPTGLLLVAGLDPGNRVLWDRYNPIVRQYAEAREPPADVLARTSALAPNDVRIVALLDAMRTCREDDAPRRSVLARVRAALSEGGAR